MGSRNENGSRINQEKHAVRNIGGSSIISKNKSEIERILENIDDSANLGTTASKTLSQLTVIERGVNTKVSRSIDDIMVEDFNNTTSVLADLQSGLANSARQTGGRVVISDNVEATQTREDNG